MLGPEVKRADWNAGGNRERQDGRRRGRKNNGAGFQSIALFDLEERAGFSPLHRVLMPGAPKVEAQPDQHADDRPYQHDLSGAAGSHKSTGPHCPKATGLFQYYRLHRARSGLEGSMQQQPHGQSPEGQEGPKGQLVGRHALPGGFDVDDADNAPSHGTNH